MSYKNIAIKQKIDISDMYTRNKKQWIQYIKWWKKTRQSFDPMPLKRRVFKKRSKAREEIWLKLLIKQRQKYSNLRK